MKRAVIITKMEEESEKTLLTEQEPEITDTKKEPEATPDTDKEANAESTLIPADDKKDEKRNRFFSFFERKKISSSENNDEIAPVVDKKEPSNFNFRKIFKKEAIEEVS